MNKILAITSLLVLLLGIANCDLFQDSAELVEKEKSLLLTVLKDLADEDDDKHEAKMKLLSFWKELHKLAAKKIKESKKKIFKSKHRKLKKPVLTSITPIDVVSTVQADLIVTPAPASNCDVTTVAVSDVEKAAITVPETEIIKTGLNVISNTHHTAKESAVESTSTSTTTNKQSVDQLFNQEVTSTSETTTATTTIPNIIQLAIDELTTIKNTETAVSEQPSTIANSIEDTPATTTQTDLDANSIQTTTVSQTTNEPTTMSQTPTTLNPELTSGEPTSPVSETSASDQSLILIQESTTATDSPQTSTTETTTLNPELVKVLTQRIFELLMQQQKEASQKEQRAMNFKL